MEAVLVLISGGASGALLVFLLRGWISERLKQSIQHEYSQKLENHKAELNARIQVLQHENQLRQLRTSLFFDHQRDAFASLTAKIFEVNETWAREHFDMDTGLDGPVPQPVYQELRKLFQEHQLFLDQECVTAMQLVFDCYTDSFPIYDGSGGPPTPRELDGPYTRVRFLQPLIAELFRVKIGVSSGKDAIRDIALLGAMRLVNRYHFDKIGLPPNGTLSLGDWVAPGEVLI